VPNYFEKSHKYTYRRIPVYDNSTTDLTKDAPSIVSFISNALHYGSVLVHCQRGVSRSSTCVLFYLMNKVGMNLEEALALIKRRRPCVEPIPAFLEQLKRYEVECKSLRLIKKQIGDGNGEDGEGKEGCDDVSSSKKRKAESQGKRVIGPMRPIGPSMPPSSATKTEVKEDVLKEG
jgi:hypothetical protein